MLRSGGCPTGTNMDTDIHPAQTERLLCDSGRIAIWTRLLLTPLGLLCIWCAFLVAVRKEVIPAVLCSVFGLLFLSPWAYRWRMFYDLSKRQLIFRSWWTWRISLSDAEAVYVRKGNGGPFAGGPHIDIGLRYKGGCVRWIISQPMDDPKRVVDVLSNVSALPIMHIAG